MNKNIKILLNYVIGPLVFCVLCWSIYTQLLRQQNWQVSLQHAWQAITGPDAWKLLLAVILIFANYGLEARKWQIVVKQVQQTSFAQAYKAVLTGTTLAFFTPNRIGEYMGRVLYLGEGKRIQAISLTIVCSMGQLLVTWIAGIGGLLYLMTYGNTQLLHTFAGPWMKMVLYFTLGAATVLTLFYFRLAGLVRWVEKISWLQKPVAYIRVLESLNATILIRILSLSVLRYSVFLGQYYLLFNVFDVHITAAQVAGAVSVIFLILSIVPSLAVITDLGVRWKVGIEVVQLFDSNISGILATSLGIWIINLVVPALIGSLLILGIKVFNNRK
ncbi:MULTISPECIES: lysylphosphatidylglycerol synthase domain-containing protein [Niastella]|uniref:Flippase-like domain-containing protein n=1 Tax=Niastella soli TaxID=2821487 RepID=A0ABS3YR03_9BACT|nr:lysylphosphatidylglycerol synthase domain-containing protein [Niastella soli]MBO9200332.1 flippase-like domain-containing protein [Niastella soli]